MSPLIVDVCRWIDKIRMYITYGTQGGSTFLQFSSCLFILCVPLRDCLYLGLFEVMSEHGSSSLNLERRTQHRKKTLPETNYEVISNSFIIKSTGITLNISGNLKSWKDLRNWKRIQMILSFCFSTVPFGTGYTKAQQISIYVRPLA